MSIYIYSLGFLSQSQIIETINTMKRAAIAISTSVATVLLATAIEIKGVGVSVMYIMFDCYSDLRLIFMKK